MDRTSFEQGETIFEKGDKSDRAYLVVIGKVEIFVAAEGSERTRIAVVGPGEVFGEMGIIDAGPRSADAVAAEYTVCVSYEGDELLDLLDNNPKEASVFIKTLVKRLRETDIALAKRNAL